jgi:hypothetical protein
MKIITNSKFIIKNAVNFLNHSINYSSKQLLVPNLGRWYVEKDDKKINIKIDQSNIDHCGCCNDLRVNNLMMN